MGWRGRRRGSELRQAAYRAQVAIVSNPGHGAWTAAWNELQGARRWGSDIADTPRVIAGPLLARSQGIDEKLRTVVECAAPEDLTEVVNRARGTLGPLLELRPVWLAHIKSRLDSRLSEQERESRLGMDMDFGGAFLEGWEHEEAAISAAIAAAPLLDQVHQALIPYSGTNWLVRRAC